MPEDTRSAETERWLHVSMLAVRIVSIVLIIAAMVFLILAGANAAVLGAIFFAEEYQATSSVVGYSLAMFALLLASGMLGIWAAGRRDRASLVIFSLVSIVSVGGMIAGISTSYFSAYDSAFSDLIVTAVCVVFILFGIIAAAAGIACAVLGNGRAAAPLPEEGPGYAPSEEVPPLAPVASAEPVGSDFVPTRSAAPVAPIEPAAPVAPIETPEFTTAEFVALATAARRVEAPHTKGSAEPWAGDADATMVSAPVMSAGRRELEAEIAREADDASGDRGALKDADGLTKLPLDFMDLPEHEAGASALAPVKEEPLGAHSTGSEPAEEPASQTEAALGPDEKPEPRESARPAGGHFSYGNVPVPKVARTARHLDIPAGIAPAPVPTHAKPADPVAQDKKDVDNTSSTDMAEIEWVDFGAASRADDDERNEGHGGFLGKRFGLKR